MIHDVRPIILPKYITSTKQSYFSYQELYCDFLIPIKKIGRLKQLLRHKFNSVSKLPVDSNVVFESIRSFDSLVQQNKWSQSPLYRTFGVMASWSKADSCII